MNENRYCPACKEISSHSIREKVVPLSTDSLHDSWATKVLTILKTRWECPCGHVAITEEVKAAGYTRTKAPVADPMGQFAKWHQGRD